ncbi:MAG: hypothetical protein JO013_06975 [Alphaproteobacteria bacterium]|nr:hypothetical protein [Alphaproteobacteria bacterium]
MSAGFSGSYAAEDVTFLLKPVTMAATGVAEKERLIQTGRRHYSEMISIEPPPDEEHLRLYREALARNGARLAADVATLARLLAEAVPAPREVVLLSLARAGTPIGVLLRRALLRQGRRAAHYSISIVRDRGIDRTALAHVARRHAAADAVFVDGWTGKGAIAAELRASLAACTLGFRPRLAVITDPAGRADYAAGNDDYLIPCALLNAVGSGLVSRTILNASVVGKGEFHACLYYDHYTGRDLSRDFVDAVDGLAASIRPGPEGPAVEPDGARTRCDAFIAALLATEGLKDANLVKPGIAESTRALLRRVPMKLFVRDPADPDVHHLLRLARLKRVGLASLPASAPFRAVVLIRSLGAKERAA